MADLNLIIVTGVSTKDASLRRRPSGVVKAEFSLEVERPFARASGEPISDLFLVDVYGPLAEQCAQYVRRGTRLFILGTLNKESFVTRTGRREHLTVVKAKYIKIIDETYIDFGDVTLDELRRDQWGDTTVAEYLRAVNNVLMRLRGGRR
ncbi:MAG TPA: single-stranded DNA-binding protein [Armatimonadetes bacterium]|nr:single-stranded DNA-binding protein [Armatimonadota bacterium]